MHPPTLQRLERLQNFLQQDPDNLTLRQDIFDSALALGQFDLARTQADQVLARQPALPEWRHRLALWYMAQHAYPQAQALLLGLLNEGQENAVITYNLAYIAFAQQAYADALRILETIDQAPDAPSEALPLQLRCQHHLGQIDTALALFTERCATQAVSPSAYGVASLIAFDASQLEQAKAWSDYALQSEPQQMEALVTRGSVALAEQDAALANHYLTHALRRNPNDGRSWSALALTAMMNMDLEQAQQSFEKAVVHMPNHIGTWHGLAWCQLLLKNIPAAQASFEKALALDRNFGESHGGLAVIYAMQGQEQSAQRSIERALRLDPKNLSARYAQAVISGEVNQQETFKRMAERILKDRVGLDGRPLAESVLQRFNNVQ